MARYTLAAAAALIALAAAGPAAARQQPAGSQAECPVPTAVAGPVLPPSPDNELEDKIDQLTNIIADLSDRLASVEDALGEPDDADGSDEEDDGLDLAKLRAAHPPGIAHHPVRSAHSRHPPVRDAGPAAKAAPAPQAISGTAA